MERGQTLKILRLAPNSVFVSLTLLFQLCSLPFPFSIFFFSHTVFNIVRIPWLFRSHYVCKLYLGASYAEAKYKLFSGLFARHTCVSFSMCAFSSPLYASIWLKTWPSWVAWLLCLCPTFPLIRLGHKGSTSAIVTAGWARCVPQTGWSRKQVSLREYSVGEQKMSSFIITLIPRSFVSCALVRSPNMCLDTCLPRERNP